MQAPGLIVSPSEATPTKEKGDVNTHINCKSTPKARARLVSRPRLSDGATL